ncbi:MAG TPA: DUF3048 domain-containing protein [Candidatus Rifleibacterium sp.]|nr:DUF3048 domain-containing protein [Candidatus Rifleibacterium sp.]HPT47122.1 DUF3048 domain-containing protein [Candidatus Rifleibacterium sp.]
MKRFGVLVVLLVLLVAAPASSGAQGNVAEIRQYFELRDTISLMNLEMKRALAPDSQSSLLKEADSENRLKGFISFIEARINSFANSDTPLKYHYVKKLNNLFLETRQLSAALTPKLRAAVLAAPARPAPAVTVVAAPDEQNVSTSGKVQAKPFFDSIGMRTLAPASATVQQPVNPTSRPDTLKTPIVIKPLDIAKPVVAKVPDVPAKIEKIIKPADKALADKAKADKAKADKAQADKAQADKTKADKAQADKAKADKAKADKDGKKMAAPPEPVQVAAIVKPAVPVLPQVAVPTVVAGTAQTVPPEQAVKPVEAPAPAAPASLTATVASAPVAAAITPAIATLTAATAIATATPVSATKPPETSDKPAPTVPEGTGVMRPLAIMIENHNQSRPQSGLDQADVVYEIPVEGGITRFMAIFTRLPGIIGPVRSCREYFVDRALEIDALYVHCGGSPLGYAYISKRKINSIDEIAHGKPFFREKTRKAPHNLYSKGKDLYDYMAEKISMRLASQPVMLLYGTGNAQLTSDPVFSAKIRYHGNYSLEIKYEDGAYQRYMNDILHVDRDTGKPLRASAVVIQVAAMKTVDAVGRQEISFIGSGTAWVLEKGQRTKVTWYKDTPKTLTTYKDAAGNDYIFPRDLQIWIQVVSPLHKLFFNGQEEKPATVAGQPEIASPPVNPGKQG